MCGIGLLFKNSYNSSLKKQNELIIDEKLLSYSLLRRGPDNQNIINNDEFISIGSVLSIQGNQLCKQPLISNNNDQFLWNGEIFGGDIHIPDGMNDTEIIFNIIINETSKLDNINEISLKLINILSKIYGPYSFIYYHSNTKHIFYGRDPFGRRNLVLARLPEDDSINLDHYNDIIDDNNNDNDDETNDKINNNNNIVLNNHIFLISSIPFPNQSNIFPNNNNNNTNLISSKFIWNEVSIGGIYSIPINGLSTLINKINWPINRLQLGRSLEPKYLIQENLTEEDSLKYSQIFLEKLQNAIKRRINAYTSSQSSTISNTTFDSSDTTSSSSSSSARFGILYSGGIDSLLLAATLHTCLTDPNEPIDLLNIAFLDHGQDEILTAPDRLAGIVGLHELNTLFPTRKFNLIHINIYPEEKDNVIEYIKTLIQPLNTHMDLNISIAFWFLSKGYGKLKNINIKKILKLTSNKNSTIRFNEEQLNNSIGLNNNIKLIHEKKKLLLNNNIKNINNIKINCKDSLCKRFSKIGCLNDLCKICCDRQYRLNMISLCNNDVKLIQETVKNLNNPCPIHKNKSKRNKNNKNNKDDNEDEENEEINTNNNNEAATNESTTNESTTNESTTNESTTTNETNEDNDDDNEPLVYSEIPYESKTKVLFLGLGADEQLGGYGRHRTSYNRGGWEELRNELNKDLKRLWQRNLGRDDSSVSDHGKEAWFPFLDEEVVDFIQTTPLNMILNLSYPQGSGDKRILRQAAESLGLKLGPRLVKRAIQFGTNVAKQTSKQYYGSIRKGKGTSNI